MKSETRDREQCASAMRNALVCSGLSQEAFAAAIGTSASRFTTYKTGAIIPSATLYIRTQRLGGALQAAKQTGLMSAPSTAQAIAHALKTNDQEWAWKVILQGRDHLRFALTEQPDAISAWEAAPRTTGSVQWDALLAALTGNEFAVAGLATPAWATGIALGAPWIPEHPFLDEAEVRERTPAFLRRVNIFTPANDLVTA